MAHLKKKKSLLYLMLWSSPSLPCPGWSVLKMLDA